VFESLAFIGAGRVARIMLGGWQRAHALPADIRVFDTNPAAVEVLRRDFPGVRAASLGGAAGAALVFAALHPPVMAETLAAIAGQLRADAVLCSLAPKVKLAVLKEKLGGFARLARMNPNAPGIVGQGYNPIAFGDALPTAARQDLLAILAPLGQSPEVAEERLETYAVISAMGPTYFGFQFAEVERLAQEFGLDADAARAAMAAMLHGTVDLLFASDVAQETALDLVPVRPMAEHEGEIRALLQKQLRAIFTKLTT
jgi:pyrroline-5-carboxylate reductase